MPLPCFLRRFNNLGMTGETSRVRFLNWETNWINAICHMDREIKFDLCNGP
jgi:hypothetical protein